MCDGDGDGGCDDVALIECINNDRARAKVV